MDEFLIRPEMLVSRIENISQYALSSFSKGIVTYIVKKYNAKKIAEFESSNGEIPIYSFTYNNIPVIIYLSRVGAAASTIQYEEIISMGVKKLIMFGSCGAMLPMIEKGQIIIPKGAFSDEGTGKKYIKNLEYIKNNVKCKEIVCRSAKELGYKFFVGDIWTTDAFYRENIENYYYYLKKGCIATEMECSAILAASKVLKKEFYPFYFAADCLTKDKWIPRDLNDYGVVCQEVYATLALRCVENIIMEDKDE